MRILIIAPEQYPVPSPKGTSVETCIEQIAERLAIRHHVTVISKSERGLPRLTIEGNLRIVRVRGGSQAVYQASVLRWLKGKKFDYIQIDNRPGFLSKIRLQYPVTPVSIFLHSLTFVTPPKVSGKKAAMQLSQASVVIANSYSLRKQLISRYPQLAGRIKVVHLGVDLKQFRPPTDAQRSKIRARHGAMGKYAIVYVGRFIPIKGIPGLIRAAELVREQIPETKLYLVGGGKQAYTAYIKKLARRSNVPVQFVGRVKRGRMHHMYWLADCFVCPTQGHESFGLVAVESLACGTTTVASRNGGLREIISHNHTGVLIKDYHSPHAFAQAIVRLGHNRELARKLGDNGRKMCEARFSWANTGDSLERIYAGQ